MIIFLHNYTSIYYNRLSFSPANMLTSLSLGLQETPVLENPEGYRILPPANDKSDLIYHITISANHRTPVI